MRTFFIFTFTFLIPHSSFLICTAQNVQQRYDNFFLEAIVQREKGNSDAAFDLLRHCAIAWTSTLPVLKPTSIWLSTMEP